VIEADSDEAMCSVLPWMADSSPWGVLGGGVVEAKKRETCARESAVLSLPGPSLASIAPAAGEGGGARLGVSPAVEMPMLDGFGEARNAKSLADAETSMLSRRSDTPVGMDARTGLPRARDIEWLVASAAITVQMRVRVG
jgi:hypothetical protein